MNNKLKMLSGIVAAFVIGASYSNIAMSDVANSRVAVVDVQKVVNSSGKVQALKKDQQDKAKELTTFIDKARKDIANVKDVDKKKNLEQKYAKELSSKKEAYSSDYSKKLAETDVAISNQIANVAKANGYDIVITKAVVLYGGNDITEDVKLAVAESEKAAAKAATAKTTKAPAKAKKK